jgi:Ca-activated chloride channel homolog
VSFMAPWGLLAGLLAGPLLALYFLRIRRRRMKVPSLMLWHALKKSERLASPFQRFRRNLLLMLQLLALLLLVLAFARPYFETSKSPYRSVVLVVDTSASMGATDLKPTRMAAAITQAQDVLKAVGPTDEVMLVTAGTRTEVTVPFTREMSELRTALDQMVVTEAEGSLREGVQLAISLAKSRPDVEVLVLSDGGGESLSDLPTGNTAVRFVPIGVKSSNAGLVALDLRRSVTSDLELQLFVTAQNFGDKPVDGAVEVYLDGKLVGARAETLPEAEPVSLVFDLPGNEPGLLEVRLDAPDDVLPADDVAYAMLSAAASRKVLLVGGDALTARALRADPRVELHLTKTSQVARDGLDDYDAVVFDGPVPDNMDGLSYMVLGPNLGGPVSFGAEMTAPKILGWRRTHPVMRFVGWDGVTIARATKVTDGAGLVPLVDGAHGPLVLAGERQGGRVVQLAFDPLHTDLPLRVAWPVLLLNSMGWMTESHTGGNAPAVLAAGTPWTKRAATDLTSDQISLSGPRGHHAKATLTDGLVRVTDTDRVGVYEVVIGDSVEPFAVNLLSPRESNVAPQGSLGLQSGEEKVANASMAIGKREIWRPLLMLALLVLCLEWFMYHRRRVA